MLNQSYNQSLLKDGNKTGLDTTRYTTFTGSNFCSLSQAQPEMHKKSKYDDAFRKARSMIDQLIGMVQDKRQDSKMAIKNIGDANEYLLDVYNDTDIFSSQQQQPAPHQSQFSKQVTTTVDLQKLQLLKVIETQRNYNQNLQRKCNELKNQNIFLRQSRASGVDKVQKNEPQMTRGVQIPIPFNNLVESRLFSQLQNLKQQNQFLRQKTINLLQSYHY